MTVTGGRRSAMRRNAMCASAGRMATQLRAGCSVGVTTWKMALAAVAAAKCAGVSTARAVDALSRFEGVKRRMERTATVSDIAIYDDFAHHPTAIRRTINAVRRRYPGQRVVVAIEPRSNTMKLGVHNDELADSLKDADLVWMFRPDGHGRRV